jgi:hypothetical protein
MSLLSFSVHHVCFCQAQLQHSMLATLPRQRQHTVYIMEVDINTPQAETGDTLGSEVIC